MESTLSRFGTDSNFVSFFLGATMSYLAAMELQTQIDELKASLNRQKLAIIALASVIVAGVGVAAIQPAGDATFDTITCKAWKVVDKDGKLRINAATYADGQASVQWNDKDGMARIAAGTNADGQSGVGLFDKDGKVRISATTLADGSASVKWWDKDEKVRISAGVSANGTVELPTKDLKSK